VKRALLFAAVLAAVTQAQDFRVNPVPIGPTG
jgi:hypothetical protein